MVVLAFAAVLLPGYKLGAAFDNTMA